MATIEERLDKLCRYAHNHGIKAKTTETHRAIVADWNAALDAMKALDAQSTVGYTDWQKCRICSYSIAGHSTRCPIPQLQAAIAQMERPPHQGDPQ